MLALDRPGTSLTDGQARRLLRECKAEGIAWALDDGTLHFQTADPALEACISEAAGQGGFRTVPGFLD